MRHRSTIACYACALLALAPLTLVPACATRAPHADARVDHRGHRDALDLSWLEGSWTTQAWGGTLNADYATRDDATTIGYSVLTKDATQAYHEFEVFAHDADGYYLVPHPGGKPAPRFKLISKDTSIATYENPDKDFPTRIVYQRFADTLIITLSDPFKNSSEPIVFTFTPRTN